MSRGYASIGKALGEHIRALHEKHPKLGHSGIGRILRDEGYDVDANELERFLKQNRIKPEKAGPPVTFRGVSRYLVGHQFTAGRLKGTAEDD